MLASRYSFLIFALSLTGGLVVASLPASAQNSGFFEGVRPSSPNQTQDGFRFEQYQQPRPRLQYRQEPSPELWGQCRAGNMQACDLYEAQVRAEGARLDTQIGITDPHNPVNQRYSDSFCQPYCSYPYRNPTEPYRPRNRY